MNISLPADQITFIDNLVVDLGYANRSELMRSIVRFIKREPKVLSQTEVFPMNPPSTRSRSKILAEFQDTSLYNKGFMKDLEAGLKRSDYFTD
jgi:Arc/MetJ-type ribon-helix-helix transcriptional regulator